MKESYSKRVILSFIGIGLCVEIITGTVFFGMNNKMITEKHSLVISDYTNQTMFYINKQMEKIREIADFFMFDDAFKYTLRQEYDDFEAYDVLINRIEPSCQSMLRMYGSSMGIKLYIKNHTLKERYYTESGNGVSILYEERLKGDKIFSNMRENGSYILWTQTEQDKVDGRISIYARLINFNTMREEGAFIINVDEGSVFPDTEKENNPPILFGVEGDMFSIGDILPEDETDDFRITKTPLAIKGFNLVSAVEKDYCEPRLAESIKNILFVFLITMPLVFILGYFLSHVLYRDINNILRGIKKVQNGDETFISEGKYAEFNEIVNVLNEYIESVDSLVQDVYEVEIQKQDIEFSMLQSKINPHFLYNIFTVIRGLARAGFNNEIIRVVDTTSDFYRKMLSKGVNDYTLREEIDSIRSYVGIIDIIKQKEIAVQYFVDEDTQEAYIPRFLIQPIVENSVKHAVEGSQLLITVSARHTEDSLIIEVEDNGAGMTEEQITSCMQFKESGGYGIYNIVNRLRLKYSDPRFGLKIFSRKGEGTKVVFTLPYSIGYPEEDLYV